MFWFWFAALLTATWFVANSKSAKVDAAKKGRIIPGWAQFGALVVLSPIIALLAAFVTSCTGGNEKQIPGTSNSSSLAVSKHQAYDICKTMFENELKRNRFVTIPSVPDNGSGDEYYFAWNKGVGMIETQYEGGYAYKMSGACVVKKSTGSVVHITLNGKNI